VPWSQADRADDLIDPIDPGTKELQTRDRRRPLARSARYTAAEAADCKQCETVLKNLAQHEIEVPAGQLADLWVRLNRKTPGGLPWNPQLRVDNACVEARRPTPARGPRFGAKRFEGPVIDEEFRRGGGLGVIKLE
jgi:hypothetical protein